MTNGRNDLFTPQGSLSREKLMAYAEGRLDPAEAHEVELHLEADPLLQDAVEGLMQPGGIGGLEALHAQAPVRGGNAWMTRTFIAGVVVVAGIVGYQLGRGNPDPGPVVQPHLEHSAQPESDVEEVVVAIRPAEISSGVELPESLRIGHATTERHSLAHAELRPPASTSTVDRTTIEPLEPITTTAPTTATSVDRSLESRHKPSLQLVYLHDLKLLHPKEMYGRSPGIEQLTTGVDARYTSALEQQAARQEERRVAYLTFMDEALDKFVRNDHKGCLEELGFLLTQYPDDVNALFYAGLCSYNLGLTERAEGFLDRAAHHRFQVFDEEADWYHALAMDRSGKKDLARSAFERIARSKSFYAPRAQARMR